MAEWKKMFCDRDDCQGVPGCPCVPKAKADEFNQVVAHLEALPAEYSAIIKNSIYLVMGWEPMAPNVEDLGLEIQLMLMYCLNKELPKQFTPLTRPDIDYSLEDSH